MADTTWSLDQVSTRAGASADAELRLRRRRRRETIFVWLGIASTFVALVTLAALLIDLIIAGYPRLTWDFFTNFPSRRASQAGILSAWVGSLLVILTTAVIGVFLGVSAGIYLEEYARRNWITNIIEINISNLAGVPSIVYGLLALGLFVYALGTGRNIFTAGLTLALLILPDHRRRDARGDPRRSGKSARGSLWHRLHEMAGDAATTCCRPHYRASLRASLSEFLALLERPRP